MLRGFTMGVSVDVLCLKINEILEYNPPYLKANFMPNPCPTIGSSSNVPITLH